MLRSRSPLATLVVGLLLLPLGASVAQESGAKPAQGPQAERPAAAEPEGPQVPWLTGPMQGNLGVLAHVQVKDGCGFADDDGTRLFLTRTQNPTNGSEQGMVICEVIGAAGDTSQWFAVFEYDDVGYVKDDEKGSLDADAILKSLREGNEAGNEYRREKGWAELELVGWERTPYYDPATNNLTWATRVRASDGGESINHSVRLLGRGGVMKVDLVVAPESYGSSMADFGVLVASHEFNAGLKYAEWRDGDRVAAYGLTALVAGGAGALALKSGLLGKFWKLIVAAGVAIAAGVRKLFGGKQEGAAG
jgi:uncharacterized membrane-anchored protein